MTLRDLKASLLDPQAQVVLFRREGLLVDSCHSIARLDAWEGRSLYELVPLLRSMKMVFHSLGSATMDLPCVEFDLEGVKGFFDFQFMAHPEDPGLLVWLIRDQTRVYRYYQGIQQERNLLRLEQEYREHGKSA
jgi:hypothetical protein